MPNVDVIRANNGQFNGSRGHGGGNSASSRGSVSVKMAELPISPTTKSEIAKQSAKYVGAEIQRYSEEHNEPILAHGVGGHSMSDNEPVDILVVRKGKVAHGIELKTMVDNANCKITMKASAMQRKHEWMKEHGAPFHTVVFDDHQVYKKGEAGLHDESKRVILYRRGFGSFRTPNMHKCEGMEELNRLLDTPDDKLPLAARPPKNYVAPPVKSA